MMDIDRDTAIDEVNAFKPALQGKDPDLLKSLVAWASEYDENVDESG